VKRARKLVGAVAAAGLAFGAYSSTANAVSATATLGLGLGGNASGSTRRMGDTTNYLTYELYQDSGRTTVWNDSGAGLLSPSTAPSKAPRNFTVYGRVTGSQDVPAGNYNDTVVATVNF
jgi:spore coat protein U domain-containing protein, fimbrial subunit CupE1/2/3/6